jgi:hypothetical protein
MSFLQEWGRGLRNRVPGSCIAAIGIGRYGAQEEPDLTFALIALAVVMLIWALVTWDDPAEQPARERGGHL